MLLIGWLLVLAGVVGLFLPFLQGVLLILAGGYILSRESVIIRGWYHSTLKKCPGLEKKLSRFKKRVRRRSDAAREEDPNGDRSVSRDGCGHVDGIAGKLVDD
jgi:hypothetical protein